MTTSITPSFGANTPWPTGVINLIVVVESDATGGTIADAKRISKRRAYRALSNVEKVIDKRNQNFPARKVGDWGVQYVMYEEILTTHGLVAYVRGTCKLKLLLTGVRR